MTWLYIEVFPNRLYQHGRPMLPEAHPQGREGNTMRIEIDTIDIVVFKDTLNWQVLKCSLSTIEPRDVFDSFGQGSDDAWKTYFKQDLFQVRSRDDLLCLDLGWDPEGESSGCFLLQLLGRNKNPEFESQFDWESPLMSYTTSSLAEVVAQINRIMQNEV